MTLLTLSLAVTGCGGMDIEALRIFYGLEKATASRATSEPERSQEFFDPTDPDRGESGPDLEPPEGDDFGQHRDDDPMKQIAQKGPTKDKDGFGKDKKDEFAGDPRRPPRGEPGVEPREPGPRTGEDLRALGEECRTSRADGICLGLKYAIYATGERQMSEAMDLALENLESINGLWRGCDVQYQIDRFVWVDPERYELPSRTAHGSDLDRIREALSDDETLLLVTTENWDRRGSLGGGANAWTRLPGGATHGAVLEERVGDFPNLIAHELGHYLGLGHSDDADRLMSPVIHPQSQKITRYECEKARRTALKDWEPMLRR